MQGFFYERRKNMKISNNGKKRMLSFLLVLLGNVTYAVTVKLFVLPANLMSCGSTGLALLANHLASIPVSAFLLVFNTAMLLIGWAVLGRTFAATTVFSSLFYPMALEALNRLSGTASIWVPELKDRMEKHCLILLELLGRLPRA